ncbi:MAG: PLP-dependent aminotransferase family protein [Desulfobacteraceae bacterium]|nr:MAG: PLP-dependent aminotransferase family protein [Desulfobacteraceae bacterium]
MEANLTATQLNFRYARLADEIEHKIWEGDYKAGEKLPSIRKLHDQTGYSITTAYQAYIELEKRGVVEPRLKSGFYVKPLLRDILPSPKLKRLKPSPKKVTINALAKSIVESMSDPDVLQLGGAAPVPELLPYKQLFRSIKSNMIPNMKDIITNYENPSGAFQLRRQIAKRTLGVSNKVTVDEIIITNGCMEAVNICLRAVAKPGDTIIVESPTFFCFLQLIEDLNMLALEIPTDPVNGIDIKALEQALDKNDVKACIFIPNFHNPLGYVMSSNKKRQLVELLSNKNIPIIEDDIYGDLYFGKTRPSTLKSFDKKGMVLYCSSFSKTLAPGLRIGWTIPGIFKDTVKRLKLNTSIVSPTLNQYIISEFLRSGSYDRHLRKLRTSLKNQVSNTALAIARYFPEDTKITAPQGGLILWVQLNDVFDGLKVYHEAKKHNIYILPGILCSSSKKYKNCIRISCRYPWDDKVEKGIIQLAKIIARFC